MASRLAMIRLNNAVRVSCLQPRNFSQGCQSLGLRRAMTTEAQLPPVRESVKNKQDSFQTGEPLPVHIKGGALDGVMYRFTMGCCIVSVAWILKLIFDLARPKNH